MPDAFKKTIKRLIFYSFPRHAIYNTLDIPVKYKILPPIMILIIDATRGEELNRY